LTSRRYVATAVVGIERPAQTLDTILTLPSPAARNLRECKT